MYKVITYDEWKKPYGKPRVPYTGWIYYAKDEVPTFFRNDVCDPHMDWFDWKRAQAILSDESINLTF